MADPTRIANMTAAELAGEIVVTPQRATRKTGYVPPRPAAPWERQAGEPAQFYRAFKIYRDLGPARTYNEVAKQIGTKSRRVPKIAVAWRWVERVGYWDQEVDRREAAGRLKAVEKMNERHASLGFSMTAHVATRLRDFEPERLSNKDVALWAKTGTVIERAARGVEQRPGININVQQAQQQTASAIAVSPGEKSIAELLERNPELLGEVLPVVDGLIDAAHSMRNTDDVEDEAVPRPD